MSSKDFLVELGTEELPPRSLPAFIEHLQTGFTAQLDHARLLYTGIQAFATPRRLAVLVSGLALQQPDQTVDKRGPALKAAFDDNGQPTPAARGFAQSCGTTVDALDRMETDKGSWLLWRSLEPGQTAAELMPTICETVFRSLPVARRMRWGDSSVEFVRPVHWLVMMLGEKVLDASLLGHRAGNTTHGHRFMTTNSGKQVLTIGVPGEYLTLLESARVQADFKQRQTRIEAQLLEAATQGGGQLHLDEGLLREVTALVEWPTVLMGTFDPEFLQVPDEALISAMSKHQRYFHLTDSQGRLLPCFLTVSNIVSQQPKAVIAGNERVLKARLSDARFFYETDAKTPLAQRCAALEKVVFQEELGNYLDKSLRIARLSAFIGKELGQDTQLCARAGELCKADLLTDMVGEFPDLQGIMGGYYAQRDGEPESVSAAISEHYRPNFAGDLIPTSAISQIVSLADRLDTLLGLFAIGQPPSGSRDPFALRRSALGAVRILLEAGHSLDLLAVLNEAASLYSDAVGNKAIRAVQEVFDYLLDRTEYWYQEQSVPVDVFRAIRLSRDNMANLTTTDHKIRALDRFRSTDSAPALVEVNKRVANILKGHSDTSFAKPQPELFQETAEQELHDAISRQATRISELVDEGDFDALFLQLAGLQPVIDKYFIDVMVMCDQEALRNNRLASLNRLRELFLQVADLSVMHF